MKQRHDYVSFEVKFFTNAEVLDLGRELAFRLMASIAWCHGNRTDGFIKAAAGRDLVPSRRDRERLQEHWWEPVLGGWRIHNYLEHQPSRAQMEAWSQAGQTAANARHHGRGRQGSEAEANGSTNRMRTASDSSAYQDLDQRTQTENMTTSAAHAAEAGAEVEASLELLQRCPWYVDYNAVADRVVLAEAKAEGVVLLRAEVQRFIERGSTNHVHAPRKALQGWLAKAAKAEPVRLPGPEERAALEAFRLNPSEETKVALREARKRAS